MPPLVNIQHEIFAQEVAKGRKLGEAYARAGFSPHSANPTRLRRNWLVAERITEIRQRATERAAERLVISKQRVLEELARIGFANILDYVQIGEDGQPTFQWGNLTRGRAAAIQEVVIDEFVDGRGADARKVRRVRFKLASKQAALEQIGNELGMFVRRTNNRHQHERKLIDLSPEERRQEILRLTRLARQVIERARTIEGEAVEVIEESEPSGS